MWSDGLADLSRRCDAVCFGTLGQRSPDSRRVIERFVAGTSDRTLRVLDLNLRPPYTDREVIDASLQMANVLKLNDSELKVLAEHLPLSSDDEPGRLIELAERMDFRAVALTQGPRGALLYQDGATCQVDSQSVQVEDTVGAGDAFNTAIVIGLIRGAELETIGRSACRIAEYVCEQKGATPQIPGGLDPEFGRSDE